ncbi:MAG TPA: hypothetical protein VGC06_22070 [Actinomycetes bacterium]
MADGGVGLTAEQRALARVVCQQWVGHGLTLQPADRTTAEAGVRLVYRAAGLPPPQRVVWAGSPLAGAVAALALTAGSEPGLRVAPEVWEQIWVRLAAEAGMPAGDPVWAHLAYDQVGAPVWSRLRDPVWDAWWAAWAQVGEPVWEEAAAHAAAVDARVGAVGEVIWQQVSGQLAEAGVGLRVQEAVRRHVGEPDQAWDWEWLSEIWPGLLAKVARRAWLPPWELVVAAPGAGSDVWDGSYPWEAELEDDTDNDALPRQLAEELPDLNEEDAWDLDEAYWDSVQRGPFEEEVRSGWYTRGQHDAGALALIEVLDRAVGLRPGQPLAGQVLIGRSAGWWWPFEQAVILTERPCALDPARDEQGRLHHPTGPLVAYRDGWGVWAWHGVRVPRQLIERPDTITVEQIRATRNLEVRRVLLERYGPDRYLRDADATLAHVDEYGKLWRCDLPAEEPLTMVEVVNATPEPDGTHATYLLRVPPGVRTAKEAVAWTFDMATDDYHPAAQT